MLVCVCECVCVCVIVCVCVCVEQFMKNVPPSSLFCCCFFEYRKRVSHTTFMLSFYLCLKHWFSTFSPPSTPLVLTNNPSDPLMGVGVLYPTYILPYHHNTLFFLIIVFVMCILKLLKRLMLVWLVFNQLCIVRYD